ncbi:MAG TPA: FkbM family methyltransferase [Solirubrobacteraceae bacterium]|jgi:FkbM family methyltransferase|nr:FkbM family methyltransferase [Solirubrobacteraceae bacterium]
MTTLRSKFVEALRRLGARPRLLPLLALYQGAPTVKPTFAFLLREASARKGVFLYRVRENGMRAAIRHRRGDVVILGEVFNHHDYRPTGEVERALTQVSNIVDLGGNIGLFGLFAAARWPDAKIIAFEPDPDNAAIHERTIAANGLAERWQLVQAAACNENGRASFVAGLAAVSHIADPTEGEQTIEVPLIDVLPQIAQADLLKMDIEGGEWAILGDPRFREAPPRAVVLEYHSHLSPGPDSRADAEAALRAAGMQIQPISYRDDGHGMLWAWRA